MSRKAELAIEVASMIQTANESLRKVGAVQFDPNMDDDQRLFVIISETEVMGKLNNRVREILSELGVEQDPNSINFNSLNRVLDSLDD